MMKRLVAFCLVLSTFAALGSQVHFPLFDSSGNPILRNIVVAPSAATAVQKVGSRIVVQPSVTVKAGATTNLLSADYTWQIAGFSTIYHMPLPDTNVVLEAAEISTDLTTYLYTNPPIAAFAAQAAQSGLVNTNDSRALIHTNAGNIFAGDGSRLTGIVSDWTGTAKFLLAATSAGEYQLLSAVYDDNGTPTNGVILWPDNTYGAFSASIDPTWLSILSYAVTYTNAGKTITQPAILRDQNGNATNVPALVITP